ncbi:hypothetical protein IKE83_01950 [Candidatus Saccharibacteria bacterium]|nr:hypothetical protein [Candidatus Saccharibacteria bacterium]
MGQNTNSTNNTSKNAKSNSAPRPSLIKSHVIVPDISNHFFVDKNEKHFVEALIEYLATGYLPETTPAIWQDIEIYIRYLKRDVWSVTDQQKENAIAALTRYQLKYIASKLKKAEIADILADFFQSSGKSHILDYFSKRFHANIDDLFLIQEKRVIDKDELDNFDQIFEFPAWLEFTDAATDAVFDKILNRQLTNEQIDYFLGATDSFKNYDKWFTLAKYIFQTTKDAHVFWLAGDILSIIWKAVPTDTASQKWFHDQIFDIFWPHVNNVWPMLHPEIIDFDANDETKILRDSIGWLDILPDIKSRLPELGKNYRPNSHIDNEEELFAYACGYFSGKINSGDATIDDILTAYFNIADRVYDKRSLEELEDLKETSLIPAIRKLTTADRTAKLATPIEKSIKHAKEYVATLSRERANLARLIDKKSA